MNIIERIKHSSERSRMLIAIVFTALGMALVVYVWYASFTSSISGSFQVYSSGTPSTITGEGVEPITNESFFDSLKGLVGDININTERLSEIRASFMGIFGN